MKQGYCIICFKPLLDSLSFNNLFMLNQLVCNKCKSKLKIINIKEFINGVETSFIYEYNTFLRELIYKYKGCYDIELAPVFLNFSKDNIKKNYKGYTIIYPPSNVNSIKERGFDHILEMVKCLKLDTINVFYKTKEYKQSDHHFNQRDKIKDIIKIKENTRIDINKKYLIIDDIYTSGNTLKTIIYLLVSHGVKKENIKALIVSKTIV